MFDSFSILSILLFYMLVLFLLAVWVEGKSGKKGNPADSALVYALSLGVYCTTWTFYGSVGNASVSGLLFLGVYIGPTCSTLLWWIILRKMVHIKNTYRITSLADFISARYGKSQTIGALVSIVAFFGTVPYISLQFKSLITSFRIISFSTGAGSTFIRDNVGLIVVGLMIGFTIVFGLRKIDPTERHRGMIFVIAVESLIKLATFLSIGIYVTYFLFDGPGDIMGRFPGTNLLVQTDAAAGEGNFYATWSSFLILSMFAILFLPRQFHVAVVENAGEKHILTAMWVFPLYMVLITFFVIPIAVGGLLQGLSPAESDFFVLLLPRKAGKPLLSLAAFAGGFSAATSMIMITSMTMAVMIGNYLFLPLTDLVKGLGFLRHHILATRWAIVAGFILLGYGFYLLVGDSYMLVGIGIISFAAILQFAPAALGGLFWRQAHKNGALLGLGSGFIIWFYTLILPSFVKSGWVGESFLEKGLLGIPLLRPEQLFGLSGLSPVPHSVFWSMLFNIGFFVLGSLLSHQSIHEIKIANDFVDALKERSAEKMQFSLEPSIRFGPKKEIAENLLTEYFPEKTARDAVEKAVNLLELKPKQKISIIELSDFYGEIEKKLAGAIGAAAAHKAVGNSGLLLKNETDELSRVYGEIMIEMRITPEDLRKKIDYYREKSIKARMEGELNAAAALQRYFTPEEPESLEGFELDFMFHPAREVSGDYYDIIRIDERYLALVVADVSGKGVAAAMYANISRVLLRDKSELHKDPVKLMCSLNLSLKRELHGNNYITMSYLLLDLETGTVTYVSAGHEPLVLVEKEGREYSLLKPPGYPLSELFAELFEERIGVGTHTMKSGDLIFCYTDGLTDVMNEEGEMFGEKRLFEEVQKRRHLTAQEILSGAYHKILSFQGETEQMDDITMIALKRL